MVRSAVLLVAVGCLLRQPAMAEPVPLAEGRTGQRHLCGLARCIPEGQDRRLRNRGGRPGRAGTAIQSSVRTTAGHWLASSHSAVGGHLRPQRFHPRRPAAALPDRAGGPFTSAAANTRGS